MRAEECANGSDPAGSVAWSLLAIAADLAAIRRHLTAPRTGRR
ncbi:hypothetical protein EDC02_6339 [Micromonospora sp. Llam0]|nr:hypothetical protein EDC02_6339 [Micromonospora sp. Llam0]